MRPRLDARGITSEAALATFIECIELTGGLVRLPNGAEVPVADLGWLDLGDAYVKACAALGRQPMLRKANINEALEAP